MIDTTHHPGDNGMSESYNEIQHLIASARLYGGVQARMIYVTPRLARLMLTLVARNRTVSTLGVSRYAQDITSGDWFPSCAGVGIDDHGVLLDGQHRLHAIIEADQAAVLLVVTGLPRGAQEKIDRHRKRTLQDVWKMTGLTDTRKAAPIANFLSRYDAFTGTHTNAPDKPDTFAKSTYLAHREAIEWICSVPGAKDHRTGIATARPSDCTRFLRGRSGCIC
jgi:hypothetical protein